MAEYIPNPVAVQVFRWGPTWTEMVATAKAVGGAGIMFELLDRGDDVPNDLRIYDSRFRSIVVYPGEYIVISKDTKTVRVLNRSALKAEYHQPENLEELL